ncbi:MAG TPA: hypothetical protein VMZ11_00395 [Mycobacteriales bacterium]|nr:hypothetical protein [Mycobacteriales bacterium]
MQAKASELFRGDIVAEVAALSADEPGVTRHSDARLTGAPRWVKAFGLVVLALVLVLLVLQLAGVGGDHGPGRHG